MKKVYIVLTYTGTVLSKIIKFYTKAEFSHVSISLDNELNEMYSFGRLNPYNPFLGGFVHESIHYGTFKRFRKTETKIYSLLVDDREFNNVKEIIEQISFNKNLYKFNIIGLFAVSIHKKIQPKKSFYCAEFVKYVLEMSGIEKNLPEIIKPDDFKNIKNLNLIYQGRLNKYNVKKVKLLENILNKKNNDEVIV